MDAIISTFHIDWKIIIAQAVNFGVVFVVLYVYALKPLSKLMKERADKIEGGIKDSKKSRELLEQATQEYEQNTIKLRQISIEAQKELEKELNDLRNQNIEKIKADNAEWVKQKTKQMEIDKKILVEEAKKEVVNLALLAAEKLTGTSRDSFNKKVIEDLNKI